MCFNALEYAARCRATWQEQLVDVDGTRVTPRAQCTTCRCFTIPVRLVHDDAGECRIDAPGKFPCPVCGQTDQYIMVWINARARHHAESQRQLRELGFVTHHHGPLRAPRDAELPDPQRTPFTGFATVGIVASVNTLRVNAGDPRFIPATGEDAPSLDCADCRALVGS